MKRREFLRIAAITGLASTFKLSGGLDLMAQKVPQKTGGTMIWWLLWGTLSLFRRGIAELGGMGAFVKKGQIVTVKPNIGWDKSPEMGANTNPELVAEIVKQCLKVGAKEVWVFDHSCDNWQRSYTNSGIQAAAKEAGAKVLPSNEMSYYRDVSLPKGVRLKSAKIHQAILDCDVWINVPILKTHGGPKMTISMKNLMGIVWDRNTFHRSDLQQCIADICTLEKKAVLNVVDAYRVMKSNGPQGRSESDIVLAKAQFLSRDIVAVDTAATKFFNQIQSMPLESVTHIGKGEALKLGSTNLDKMNVKRINL